VPKLPKAGETGLAQGDDERAQLTAALGHDIRAPLQVLGLSLQGLRLRARDADEQELIFAAESALEEVASLTDDLVDSLRFGVGAEPLREEGVTLANVLRAVERRFQRRAAQQKVQLRVFPTRIHCVTDRRYLQRILDNLVSNALKHADAKRIVVGARLRSYDTLVLEVVDDGRGIPEAEQPFIFEESYRCGAAEAASARGQGLGLWIVRRFANDAGGRVAVKSRLGCGARFIVELPTYAERRPPLAPRLASHDYRLSRRLIALLNEDEDVLRTLGMSFEALGANVFASTDELHFLANVSCMPTVPDLLILDLALGERSVDRTLRNLQARFGREVRAIVVSNQNLDLASTKIMSDVRVMARPLTEEHMHEIVAMLAKPSIECRGAT
jgi:two-component sensor histidine kinase